MAEHEFVEKVEQKFDKAKEYVEELLHPDQPPGPQNPPKRAVVQTAEQAAKDNTPGPQPGPAPAQEFPVAPAVVEPDDATQQAVEDGNAVLPEGQSSESAPSASEVPAGTDAPKAKAAPAKAANGNGSASS